jgi:hypothetical protein
MGKRQPVRGQAAKWCVCGEWFASERDEREHVGRCPGPMHDGNFIGMDLASGARPDRLRVSGTHQHTAPRMPGVRQSRETRSLRGTEAMSTYRYDAAPGAAVNG